MRKKATTAKLVLMGDYSGDSGRESQMWGRLYIDTNEALTKITNVVSINTKTWVGANCHLRMQWIGKLIESLWPMQCRFIKMTSRYDLECNR